MAQASETDLVTIKIQDSGPGLNDKDLQKLFIPFYRGSAGQGVEGTGLGLAAVKNIINAHGGSIIPGNRREGGAEFTINLPTVPPVHRAP